MEAKELRSNKQSKQTQNKEIKIKKAIQVEMKVLHLQVFSDTSKNSLRFYKISQQQNN